MKRGIVLAFILAAAILAAFASADTGVTIKPRQHYTLLPNGSMIPIVDRVSAALGASIAPAAPASESSSFQSRYRTRMMDINYTKMESSVTRAPSVNTNFTFINTQMERMTMNYKLPSLYPGAVARTPTAAEARPHVGIPYDFEGLQTRTIQNQNRQQSRYSAYQYHGLTGIANQVDRTQGMSNSVLP